MRIKKRNAAAATLAIAAAGAIAGCPGGGEGHQTSASASGGNRSGGYPVRGIYDRDRSRTGFNDEAALGFNYIDSSPDRGQMRALAARHLKGFIWLGGYDNSSCSFNNSDAWMRSHVGAVAGMPGVGAYFIDDEPDASACPSAPAQIKARSDLVKSIDPKPPTFIVTYHVDQLAQFAGKVDIIGLDHYPCSIPNGCRYSIIDQEAAAADKLGIRYWGVIQAHGDDYYRQPTPAQLHQEFRHWRATNMSGYLVFAWRWPRNRPSLWLANHPDLKRQLSRENAAGGGA